jgi:hypothetical protein
MPAFFRRGLTGEVSQKFSLEKFFPEAEGLFASGVYLMCSLTSKASGLPL